MNSYDRDILSTDELEKEGTNRNIYDINAKRFPLHNSSTRRNIFVC